MELNFTKIGEKIKAARKKKGLTQEQLAEQIGLSATHISAIETDRSMFSISTLINIVTVLEISVDWLLFDQGDTNHDLDYRIKRVLSGCSEKEVMILLALLESNKAAIRKLDDVK